MTEFDPVANAEMWSHIPEDLRDTDVVRVEVIAPHTVRVTHRDGVAGDHSYTADHFRGVFNVLKNPEVFAGAQIVDGETLGWVLDDGTVLDHAPDSLYLHALEHCDGSCEHPLQR